MQPHNEAPVTLIHSLGSDAANGLPASRAAVLLHQHGPNRLKDKRKKTIFERFIEQFKDVMILILLAAAAISFGVALFGHESREFFEPVLIVLIIVLNAVLGVIQESKAQKALDALKKISALQAKVLRDGQKQVIDAAELVPGDIILLESGDFVPADARLIHSSNLKSEESMLTGESAPAEKSADAIVAEEAPLGDRFTMVFSGCSITYGTAKAIVTATGMDTEIGKIAGLLESDDDEQTPLQARLAVVGRYLGLGAIVTCAVIFVIGLLSDTPILDLFMISVALAVSAIPEGLPAVVTIVLSIGVQRMVKRNAIIRRLPAVETLGSASVICTDKTGTLTQNRMTLMSAYVDKAAGPEQITKQNSPDVQRMLMFGTLCSDGSIMVDDGKVQHIGDPTETAIVYAAYENGMRKESLTAAHPRLAELPFDSDRKLMATVNEIDSKNIVIVKGAFDVLATKCTQGNVEQAKIVNEQMGRQALRVLAIAYKEIGEVPDAPSTEELESNLTFMGLLGMIDPPRPEAKEAVRICRNAGIRPIMITGDHVLTASAIATELGILREGAQAVSGPELASMSEDELNSRVQDISVYARVSPQDKIRIVRAWQHQNHVVAMTGDGVNDAPALKAADIGCAMGITGTDVAKGAADMTLTDDNFATIVDAVREGRGIYANIRKVVGFLLGTNIGEVLAVFFAMLLWRETPLLSMQLLWINLVTDSMPAIALGREPVESHIMRRKPKPKNEGIFAYGLGVRVVLQGSMFAALALFAFWHGRNMTGELAGGQTMAFLTLALSQVVQAFNMRSERSLFAIKPFSNKHLNIATFISASLIMLVAFTPLSAAFGLINLSAAQYAEILLLALIPLLAAELYKALSRQ